MTEQKIYVILKEHYKHRTEKDNEKLFQTPYG